MITGLAIWVALFFAVWVAIANWWYAAEGTATFDYWFDLVTLVVFYVGVGAVVVGLILIAASKIRPRK